MQADAEQLKAAALESAKTQQVRTTIVASFTRTVIIARDYVIVFEPAKSPVTY